MLPVLEIIAENVRHLMAARQSLPRPELAKRIGIGDKTLGFIKSATGNPTIETIETIARYYRVQPWQLLMKDGVKLLDQRRFSEESTSTISPDARELIELILAAEADGSSPPKLVAALKEIWNVALPQADGNDYARLRKRAAGDSGS